MRGGGAVYVAVVVRREDVVFIVRRTGGSSLDILNRVGAELILAPAGRFFSHVGWSVMFPWFPILAVPGLRLWGARRGGYAGTGVSGAMRGKECGLAGDGAMAWGSTSSSSS